MRVRRASSRVRHRQPFFFLAAQARKLSLSASLDWAEKVLKRHVRVSNGDAAIEGLLFSSVGWIDRLLGSRRAWPIELVERLCLRPP